MVALRFVRSRRGDHPQSESLIEALALFFYPSTSIWTSHVRTAVAPGERRRSEIYNEEKKKRMEKKMTRRAAMENGGRLLEKFQDELTYLRTLQQQWEEDESHDWDDENDPERVENLPFIRAPMELPEEKTHLKYTDLLGFPFTVRFACFFRHGELYICFPQLLKELARAYAIDYNEIIRLLADLQISLKAATLKEQRQLAEAGVIKRSVIESGSLTTNLIRKTDASRLLGDYFPLEDEKPPENLDELVRKGFIVKHCCFGGCRGVVLESIGRIQCDECRRVFKPDAFVAHYHSQKEVDRIVHWGFDPNNWRDYINLPTSDYRNQCLINRFTNFIQEPVQGVLKRARDGDRVGARDGVRVRESRGPLIDRSVVINCNPLVQANNSRLPCPSPFYIREEDKARFRLREPVEEPIEEEKEDDEEIEVLSSPSPPAKSSSYLDSDLIKEKCLPTSSASLLDFLSHPSSSKLGNGFKDSLSHNSKLFSDPLKQPSSLLDLPQLIKGGSLPPLSAYGEAAAAAAALITSPVDFAALLSGKPSPFSNSKLDLVPYRADLKSIVPSLSADSKALGVFEDTSYLKAAYLEELEKIDDENVRSTLTNLLGTLETKHNDEVNELRQALLSAYAESQLIKDQNKLLLSQYKLCYATAVNKDPSLKTTALAPGAFSMALTAGPSTPAVTLPSAQAQLPGPSHQPLRVSIPTPAPVAAPAAPQPTVDLTQTAGTSAASMDLDALCRSLGLNPLPSQPAPVPSTSTATPSLNPLMSQLGLLGGMPLGQPAPSMPMLSNSQLLDWMSQQMPGTSGLQAAQPQSTQPTRPIPQLIPLPMMQPIVPSARPLVVPSATSLPPSTAASQMDLFALLSQNPSLLPGLDLNAIFGTSSANQRT